MQKTSTTSASSRFLFIDLLRGWAVFVMIETHVVNALLHPSIKDQSFFTVLSFMNGLVAPSFLFCAGLALAVMLGRKWVEYVAFGKQCWRYIVRIIFILIVAYSLHLPFFSYTRLMNLTDGQAWNSFYQVDILQVIALTLFILVFLVPILRRKTFYYPVVMLLGLATVFLTPIAREMDTSSCSVWIRPYLSTQVKSQFPLFPWSAFLIGGTLVGGYFVWMKEKSNEKIAMRWLLVGAVLMGVVSLLVEILPYQLYPHHSFFKYSPEFFFVRFSLVLVSLVGLWRYASNGTGWGVSVISLFGQESLLVYVVHLLIVYGYTYEFSFVRMFGPTMNYVQCAGLFVGLSALMYAMAYIWHALKGWNKSIAKTIQVAVLAGIVVAFFLQQS